MNHLSKQRAELREKHLEQSYHPTVKTLVSQCLLPLLAKRTAGTCMIFTVANVEAISEIVFNMNAHEMLIVYSNPHPGNQQRALQVRFGASALRELIRTIQSMPLDELGLINAGSE